MKQLVEALEEVFIYESFKSTALRELIADIKEINGDLRNRSGYELLPHGIAWDQIPDEDIFVGESQDPDFINKFVNNNYLVIWFSLTRKMVQKDYRSHYDGAGWYIEPGHTYITINKQFVEYNEQKSAWNVAFQAKHDWFVPARRRNEKENEYISRINKEKNNGNPAYLADLANPDKKFIPSIKNGRGPAQGHCTVKLLIESTYCSAIAISLADLAKYSTIELMQKRYEQKFNAVALMRKDTSFQERWAKNNPGKYYGNAFSYDQRMKHSKLKPEPDYPDIRLANQARYKKMITDVKSINILKKYANDMKHFQEVIDNTKVDFENVAPISVSRISAGEFADIYFNRRATAQSADKAVYLTELKANVNDIITMIDDIIRIIKHEKDPDYAYGYNDKQQRDESIRKRISRIEAAVNNAKSVCKKLESMK